MPGALRRRLASRRLRRAAAHEAAERVERTRALARARRRLVLAGHPAALADPGVGPPPARPGGTGTTHRDITASWLVLAA